LNSEGKYISVLSSDDAWYPDKLDIQVKYLDAHPNIGAVFGRVDWVDQEGRLITGNTLPFMDVFDVENRTRFQWLSHFFYKGNCLCHPSSMVRREVYSRVGLLNSSLACLPDFDFWIRMCLEYDIEIIDKKLIRFRRFTNETNASGNTIRNQIRTRFEWRQVLNHYLKVTDPDEFQTIFPEARKHGRITQETIPYFLGRMSIGTGINFRQVWGLDVIFSLLQNERIAKTLETNCDFTYSHFIELTADCDAFGIANILTTQFQRRSSFEILLSSSKRYLKEIYLLMRGRQ
jgi:hypothetical protein